MKWYLFPLAAVTLGLLSEPLLAARGGFHGGGFRGGGFRGGGFGFHGGHGFHGHHGHHRRFGFRPFSPFNNIENFDGGFAYPYSPYSSGFYPVYDTRRIPEPPPCPVYCPVPKGYSTYSTADGYYNYPKFTTAPPFVPSTATYVALEEEPMALPPPAPRRAPKKVKPCAEAGSPLVREVQSALKKKGIDAGAIDGLPGAKTGEAIKEFQSKNGMEPTGRIDKPLLQALGL